MISDPLEKRVFVFMIIKYRSYFEIRPKYDICPKS